MDPGQEHQDAGARPNATGNPTGPGAHRPDPNGPEAPGSTGFTRIAPNETRWNRLKTMAQKEEEDLQKWKESHRAAPVNLTPEKLGGNASLAEARERQLINLRRSKLQKKIQQEELDRMRRQEEEDELQKMKAKQREKSEHLEESRRQQDLRRSQQLKPEQLRTTENFLQKLQQRGPAPMSSSSDTPTPSLVPQQPPKSLGNRNEREVASRREVQLDHRRVNSAFLDRLVGQGSGAGKGGGGGSEEVTWPSCAFEDFRDQESPNPGPQSSASHLTPQPQQMEEDETELHYERAVVRLASRFPLCSRVFLEDIFIQCNGDFQQACSLLGDER